MSTGTIFKIGIKQDSFIQDLNKNALKISRRNLKKRIPQNNSSDSEHQSTIGITAS